MNAVEGDIPTEEEQLQCVELSRVWNLCAVTREETPIGNSFEALREEEEDISSVTELIEVEEDYNVPAPPRNEWNPAIRQKKRKWNHVCIRNGCCGEDVLLQLVETGEKRDQTQMNLKFQVADVAKPLVSVRRIAEKGNIVQFGPREEDNYIQNNETKDKVMLKPNGKGSYLMEVNFIGGGKTVMTVDSGAEENVCPWDWGGHFPTTAAERQLWFRNASGGIIEHYGQREVKVITPF